MFHHVKELQFDARVSGPDPRFARMLLEQFGGPNGELSAAMQYFVQAFSCRKPHPDKYDMLMDIAMEEFSHLEIVGATITMLLSGINGALKDAAEQSGLMKLLGGKRQAEEAAHGAINPAFLVRSGGGPTVTDCNGTPWSGMNVNANGDLTVDLRSNIAAESRAKITYEYLIQFTDDPHVRESLGFLMTREIAHMQMFTAALSTIEPNFPPATLQGDPRATHTYFNLSNGGDVRGPWNQGRGPWPNGEVWVYFHDPILQVHETQGQKKQPPAGGRRSPEQMEQMAKELGKRRREEVEKSEGSGEMSWSDYSRQPELVNR